MNLSIAATHNITIPTIDQIEKVIRQEVDAQRGFLNEQLSKFMQAQGFDPADSFCILPISMKTGWASGAWPSYVRFSQFIETPILMRDITRL